MPTNVTLAAKVDELYARTQISTTVRKFFLALDEKRWEAIPALLDSTFKLSAEPFAPGECLPVQQFMQTLIARNGGFLGSMHLNSDHIVDVDGTTARVLAHACGVHWIDDTDDGLWWALGRYEIDLIRDDDLWRMRALTLRIDRTGGDAAAVFNTAARRQSQQEVSTRLQ